MGSSKYPSGKAEPSSESFADLASGSSTAGEAGLFTVAADSAVLLCSVVVAIVAAFNGFFKIDSGGTSVGSGSFFGSGFFVAVGGIDFAVF